VNAHTRPLRDIALDLANHAETMRELPLADMGPLHLAASLGIEGDRLTEMMAAPSPPQFATWTARSAAYRGGSR
jgi:hypothetical protein